MGSDRTPRSSRATALAEDALAALARAAGPHAAELLVVGGLVPPMLTGHAPVGHLGTTDVDVLVEVGLVYDDEGIDYAWLEAALRTIGFSPLGAGWQWVSDRGPRVKIDLVCDRVGSANAPIPLPGCPTASGINLPGPRAARCDSVLRTLPDRGGGEVTVRFAGLGGYLLSKASAAMHRGYDRDFYDFYYVTLHNDAGGPRAAAAAIASHPCADLIPAYTEALRSVLRSALTSVPPKGADAYAREMAQAGADDDADTLRADAGTAASLIARDLGIDLT